MAQPNEGFTELLAETFPEVYRCCFLMVPEKEGAEYAALHAYLQMATTPKRFETKQLQQQELYRQVCMACEEYYYKKMRKKPHRPTVQYLAGFPISDALWKLLCSSLNLRGVFWALHCLQYTPAQAAKMLRLPQWRVKQLAKKIAPESVDPACRGIQAICPHSETQQKLEDDVFFRFSERSVAFENKLWHIHYWLNRALPWIAFGLVCIGIAAAIYTAGRGV